MASRIEIRAVATMPIFGMDQEHWIGPYDGTVEEFYRRVPSNVQETIKEYLGKNLFVTYNGWLLSILEYTIA